MDLSPPKARNPGAPSEHSNRHMLRANGGEILNSSNIMNNSFSIGNSPIKAIHKRNITDIPESTKSGQPSPIKNY